MNKKPIREARLLFKKLDAIEREKEKLRQREGLIRNKLQRIYNLAVDKGWEIS